MDVGLLRECVLSGMTRQQIADKIGMSYSYTTTILRKYGINVARKKVESKKRGPRDLTLRIIDLRKQGMKQKDIAATLCCSMDHVAGICHGYGLTKEQKLTDEHVAKIVKDSGFEYVSGYTRSKSNITVKCPTCGGTFERQFHIFNDSVQGTRGCKNECPLCRRKAIEQSRANRKEQIERDAQKRAQQRSERLSREVSEELEKRLAIHVCKNCGNEFCQMITGYNSESYCSKKCQKRYFNRSRCEKRYKKLMDREHNNDISLEKLFKRDGGVCYLCGNKCDWDDGEERDGTFIAGPHYPSIDHVVPVSKGGTHTWDNIKLACRECNWTKRDNV